MEHVSWSPDESLLVAVSESKVLTILDSNYDMVAEINLNNLASASEIKQNVGWGTEETQFTGAGAKQKARNEQQPGDGALLSEEDSLVCLNIGYDLFCDLVIALN